MTTRDSGDILEKIGIHNTISVLSTLPPYAFF